MNKRLFVTATLFLAAGIVCTGCKKEEKLVEETEVLTEILEVIPETEETNLIIESEEVEVPEEAETQGKDSEMESEEILIEEVVEEESEAQ